ncbi:MAG: hypothetical protein KDJ30_04170 [Rhodoblastus sp.]|nr:hypothetical protein [Rhodoblastus sp.]
MARIIPFRSRKIEQDVRPCASAEASENFPDLVKRLTSRLDWSEATVEDEYDAALAAFDIVCGRPASRRSRAA